MIHNQIGMEEILFDYHAPVVKPFYKEPVPRIDLNVKVTRGYFVRLKNGDVVRVDDIGRERMYKRYVDSRRRDGSLYKKVAYEKKSTFMSDIFIENKIISRYFEYDDVSECRRTIIECIYKGDKIVDRKNRYLTVKSKIINKNNIYLICEYNDSEIRINNADIKHKCMVQGIRIRDISVGDKILCKNRGWATVYEIWSGKVQAYTLSKDRLFFVSEWDILDMAEQE